MKKVILFIIIIIIGIYAFFFYNKDSIKEEKITDILDDIKEEFLIDDYYIFGNHFGIEGCIDKKLDNLELVLKNKEEEIILKSETNYKEDSSCFYISDKLNNGINLDELEEGTYLLLIKSDDIYYTLKNNTEYNNLEYYTITKDEKNNKINIDFKDIEDKNYIEFKIKEKKLPKNVYDITIDPGHGGKDSGATSKLDGKSYYESNLTLEIALLLKEELESKGLKVKLTRDSDTFISNYDKNGRAVIPNKYSTKYSISLHLNSLNINQNYGGVEVYTPNDIDLEFAKLLSQNIGNIVGVSKKQLNKIADGVYYSYFDKNDIEKSYKETKENNLKPYDIKLNVPYMFMIREVGGIKTGAYVDGRNDSSDMNLYYNSNKTAEPYLIEMAYMNYSNDLKKVVNESEKFSKAISDSICEYLNIS